jgi:hypothetical protein
MRRVDVISLRLRCWYHVTRGGRVNDKVVLWTESKDVDIDIGSSINLIKTRYLSFIPLRFISTKI